MQNPEFDQFDAGILSERERARRGLSGPLTGDFIRRKDGKLARITHVWDDAAQTTQFSDTGEGGSFHLNRSGHMEYSGGLESGLPRTHLKQSDEWRKGRAWFFHHGSMQAHNGVYFETRVRVWDFVDDAEAVNPAIPSRYVVNKGEFRGHAQTSTYTTFDGIERVAYNNGKWLSEYLRENPGFWVVTDTELESMLRKYHDSLVTMPAECTEEHYQDMLECLPPCRWKDGRFHVSERLTGNLVSWYARKNGKFYTFTDRADISESDLYAKISAISESGVA